MGAYFLSTLTKRIITAVILVGVQFAVVVLRYVFSIGFIPMQELIWYLSSTLFLLGAGYALQVDEISLPIVSQFGVHLIQLEERRMLDVSEQKRRDVIRQQIGKRKLAEKYDQFLKQLKSGAFIEYRVPVDEI